MVVSLIAYLFVFRGNPKINYILLWFIVQTSLPPFLDTLISKKENAKFPGRPIYREGVKQNMHASPAMSKEM